MKLLLLTPAVFYLQPALYPAAQGAPVTIQERSLNLPDGRVGQPYYEVLSGITTIATGVQQCPMERLPADLLWLTFNCRGQAPVVAGTVPKDFTAKQPGGRRIIHLDWTIQDELGRQTLLHLAIRILGEQDRLAAETDDLSPVPASRTAAAASSGEFPQTPAAAAPAPTPASTAGVGSNPATGESDAAPKPAPVATATSQPKPDGAPKTADLTQVVLAGEPHEGDKKVSGAATFTGVAGVAILRLQPDATAQERCLTSKDLGNKEATTFQVLETGTRGKFLGQTTSSGDFDIDLREDLKAGDRIQAVQVLQDGYEQSDTQLGRCTSDVHTVQSEFDFYRTNVTAVFGVVLSSSGTSATRSNFAEANQLLALNVDHNWVMPGYRCVKSLTDNAFETESSTGYKVCRGNQQPGYHSPFRYVGLNTFSDSRMTSIPVSTPSTENPAGTTTPVKAATVRSLATASPTDTTTKTVASLLSGAQTFRQTVGVYLPWVPVHGTGFAPRGLMLAPIAKAGFDTVTSTDIVPNVILPNSTTGNLAFQTAYKFYSYGVRLGEVGLSASPTKAPDIRSYLDISVGRFSNLQSFVCHTREQRGSNASALTAASSCATDYPDTFTNASDIYLSRKQLYRLSIEGLVQVPLTGRAVPLYVGVNANIGQRSGQAERLDHGYATPDDIRIFFGTRLDINRLAAWIAKEQSH